MAIVNNFWLKDQTKQLAGAVIYQAMGQTRSRRLAESVSNPRTVAQMSQRVKWANLVSLYRVNQTWMKYAFETKKTNQSEYNKFMSLNVSSSRIYLTKQQAAAGACVVDEYIITQGSLMPIEINLDAGDFATNIILPSSFVLSPTTTVGAFAQAALAMNPAFREGDQLSFIRLTQQTNSVTGYPYVTLRKYELILNPSSQASFWDYWPEDLITVSLSGNTHRLLVLPSGAAGAFAIVLSRTISGRTYVSTQRLHLVNMSAIISQFSSSAQLQAAIASYGESEDAFLSTVSADRAPAAAIPLSIVSVEVAGQEFIPGTAAGEIGDWDGENLMVIFNQDISSGGASIIVSLYKDGQVSIMPALQGSISGNIVEATNLPDAFSNSSAYELKRIAVQIGDFVHEANFQTSGPLE